MGKLADLSIVGRDGLIHVADPEVAALGNKILELFIKMRPTYHRSPMGVSSKFYKNFYKAAELCLLEEKTAEEFVKDRLQRMAILGKFWASLISSENLPKMEEDHNISWVRSFHHYKQQLDLYGKLSTIYGSRAVLEDETMQFTPLFRALMALENDFGDLVARYRAPALMELESNPTAKSLFSELAESLHG